MQADKSTGRPLLEIWDFGLALASRQRLPVLKRTIWCGFCLDFFAFFDFCPNCNFATGRAIFILFGACDSNLISPHDPKTPKTVMQITIVLLLEQHGV